MHPVHQYTTVQKGTIIQEYKIVPPRLIAVIWYGERDIRSSGKNFSFFLPADFALSDKNTRERGGEHYLFSARQYSSCTISHQQEICMILSSSLTTCW